MSVSSGDISASTQYRATGTRGLVSYAQSQSGTVKLRDGGASGKVLVSLSAGTQFAPCMPVEFRNGLYVEVTAGVAVVHLA